MHVMSGEGTQGGQAHQQTTQSTPEQSPQQSAPQQSYQQPPPQHQYREPGIGDIFSRSDTKYELKFGIALYALVGVALGVTMILDYALGTVDLLGLVVTWETGGTIALIMTIFVAQEQTSVLDELPNNLVYGTAAVTALVGTVLLLFLSWLFQELTAGTIGFGEVIGSWIALLVGVVLIAVGTVAIMRNL